MLSAASGTMCRFISSESGRSVEVFAELSDEIAFASCPVAQLDKSDYRLLFRTDAMLETDLGVVSIGIPPTLVLTMATGVRDSSNGLLVEFLLLFEGSMQHRPTSGECQLLCTSSSCTGMLRYGVWETGQSNTTGAVQCHIRGFDWDGGMHSDVCLFDDKWSSLGCAPVIVPAVPLPASVSA